MNITFLIGNGFDISLGYKTSYCDFYKYYCALPSDTSKPHIAKSKEKIDEDAKTNDLKNWADFEIALGKYTATFGADEQDLFNDCVDDFSEKLLLYLKKQTNDKREFQEEHFSFDLCKFHRILPEEIKTKITPRLLEDGQVNAICFNYTDVFNKCWANARHILTSCDNQPKLTKETCVFIHGTLNNNPLIGFDNTAQIHNEEFKTNAKF